MYGLGAIVHVFNILPISYFLVSPFAYGRGNLPGNRSPAYYRNYYRAFWTRLFFGRFSYVIYGYGGFVYMLYLYRKDTKIKKQVSEFTSFYEHLGEYDEEIHSEAKESLDRFKKIQLDRNNKYIIKREQAEKYHELKSRAFEKIIGDNTNV